MSGDWETASGRSQTDEHWTRPAGGSLFGVRRTIAGADFKLIKLAGQEATLENLAHDFPKRIIYRENAGGSLTARIEGDSSEKEKPQDFKYCPIAPGH
ncbi:MAG: hypothetical protein ACKVX9_10990 [Blastocatellia bacterium]